MADKKNKGKPLPEKPVLGKKTASSDDDVYPKKPPAGAQPPPGDICLKKAPGKPVPYSEFPVSAAPQKPLEKNPPPTKAGTYDDKIFTGVQGFDTLIGKGIPHGSAVLVEGGPGSGKTNFCLSMTENFCKLGKRVLYMSFEEPEEHLLLHMESFGWNPRKYVKEGIMRIKRFNALDVARSVEALLSEAKKELLIEVDPVFFPRDFKPDVVMIDSMTSISSAFSGEESRFRIYMEQLFRYLEKENITSFLIREVANPTHTGMSRVEHVGEAVSFLSDGIIVIYSVLYPSGQRGSAIEVLKMRGVQITKKIVKMDILSGGGVVVYPDEQIPATCKLT